MEMKLGDGGMDELEMIGSSSKKNNCVVSQPFGITFPNAVSTHVCSR